jgi:beta-mannosidase
VAGGSLRKLYRGEGTDLKLYRPRRWWPREHGRSELYTIVITVDSGAGRVDRSTARFAIRTVRRDGIGRLLVNERPLFLRGTNYIATQYFADFPRTTLLRDFALMEAAHINAVRVHAHVTLPAFYDLADERGMLVLQDFPLQWGYDESSAFAAEAARQAHEMVAVLYNHPSIVFWSGINEAPYSSEWMKWKYPDYDPDQNRGLERAVYAALAEDQSRPSEGNGSPAHHVWAGWYDGSYRGFARPQSHSWITEYGAQAVPSVSTLATFLRREQMWPIEKNLKVWEYHNFQLRELRDIAKVPLGSSIESLIQNTQRYQARLLQFAAENLRRQKWQPVSAVFQFMLVEHWPSMNWGMVDYLRQPKLGYSALARAYQPVLPVAVARENARTIELFVINDVARASLGCTLLVRTVPEGRLPLVLPIDLPSDDVLALKSPIARPSAAEGLVLELLDGDGALLSRNAYEAGYFEP